MDKKIKKLKPFLPYVALLISAIIWGFNFVIAKLTLQEIPIMTLSFGRFFLSFLLLTPFIFMLNKKERTIHIKDMPKILLIGLLMITFQIALFYEGLTRTSAINASVLTLIIPILSVVVGWTILKEKLYIINLLGIFIGLLGSLTILGVPLLLVNRFSSTELLGNILIILSSLFYVFGSLLSKEMLTKYSTIMFTLTLFFVGAITFLIPAIAENAHNTVWIDHLSVLGVLGFLYVTVFSSVSAFLLFIWGLSKIELSQANLFQYIEPAAAATLAVPLLSERISYSFILGTALIILGVYWGTLGKQHHHHIHNSHHRI